MKEFFRELPLRWGDLGATPQVLPILRQAAGEG
jgi:hypothetical protein